MIITQLFEKRIKIIYRAVSSHFIELPLFRGHTDMEAVAGVTWSHLIKIS